MSRVARWPVRRLRRSFIPEYEDLLAQAADLRRSLQAAEAEIARLRDEHAGTRAHLDAVDERARLLDDGLLEARRLSFRLAQLTDVVTEIVLPLHHRDIDPDALERLAPETL